jgi:hypothetical protein
VRELYEGEEFESEEEEYEDEDVYYSEEEIWSGPSPSSSEAFCDALVLWTWTAIVSLCVFFCDLWDLN